MPARRSRFAAVLALALVPAGTAQASVPHTVQPGETLWTIAAANNLTTRAFAAYNGLAPDGVAILGATLKVPTTAEAASALSNTAPAASAPAGVADQAPAAPGATAAGALAHRAPAPGATAQGARAQGAIAQGAPAPLGAYTVRPGDTLSGLAARSGVTTAAIAAMNGLDPAAQLLAGSALKLPTGSPLAAQPSLAPTTVPQASPAPASGRVTSADIAAVATRNGVPASLASAIAWQESGFNNAMVSSANARGVMQVMPGTWTWVQQNLARRQLDPSSPIDNVGAGVLYLGRLLSETGGDPAMAAAGYYQGLDSVRRIGMLPETRRYVANVLALRSRFGG